MLRLASGIGARLGLGWNEGGGICLVAASGVGRCEAMQQVEILAPFLWIEPRSFSP
jgi:hypothetical protein